MDTFCAFDTPLEMVFNTSPLRLPPPNSVILIVILDLNPYKLQLPPASVPTPNNTPFLENIPL